MEIVKKLLFLLDQNQRKKLTILMMMILIMALLDAIGVASILPFVAVITNESIIETNFAISKVYEFSKIFGIENNKEFLFFLGLFVFFLLVFSLIFKAITIYKKINFVQMSQYKLSKYLVENYLRQPYDWFLNQHSADIGKTILSEVAIVIGKGLTNTIDFISSLTAVLFILGLLFFVDFKITVILGFTVGLIYFLIYKSLKNFLYLIGKNRLHDNKLRFISISEAFSAIKEIKVGGFEKIYTENFSNPASKFAIHSALSSSISQIPRFVLEALAFGGVMLLILYLMLQTGSFTKALPIISLYVFAGYRLIPAFQKIYNSYTQLLFVKPSIEKLYDDINLLKPHVISTEQNNFIFKKLIELKNVNYNYPNTSRKTLKNINLKIKSNSVVGVIGATGSGKTTMVDIILGLLQPQNGTVLIDNKVLTKKNLKSWQKIIGYVPQHIFLSDDSIAANIAFGKKQNDINYIMVEKAAKIANLHDFILKELPQKYQTIVGERGIRLSGGQRQRIGIARALYNDPQLLILDEATSALDNQTEKIVMEAINNINKNKTIIIIAHRLNTIKNCDMILKLREGEIVSIDN